MYGLNLIHGHGFQSEALQAVGGGEHDHGLPAIERCDPHGAGGGLASGGPMPVLRHASTSLNRTGSCRGAVTYSAGGSSRATRADPSGIESVNTASGSGFPKAASTKSMTTTTPVKVPDCSDTRWA
jgi:hypothetical protein